MDNNAVKQKYELLKLHEKSPVNKALLQLISFVAIGLFFLTLPHGNSKPEDKALPDGGKDIVTKIAEPIDTTPFFEENTFFTSTIRAGMNRENFENKISGGIIPHHLVASDLIADFFIRLNEQSPDTVVIIGPNHYEKGGNMVQTTRQNWETQFETVFSNQKIINELIASSSAFENTEVFGEEHSIGGIIPFVKFYLPEAEVVPIIFSGLTEMKNVERLAEDLYTKLEEDAVIIASVDFSHYLTCEQTRVNDEMTWDVIKNHEYDELMQLNSDYLDSPASIALLLKLMERRDSTNFKIIRQTNAGEILFQNFADCTSYFEVVYYSKP